MRKLDQLVATTVVIPEDNVDTDQIIPGRFLTTTSSEGFGDFLFRDWRFDENDNPKPDFVLNQPGAQEAGVLVTGVNFGCGSSREHAPWALRDFGFRAVVSSKIADIFSSNAQKCGLLPVVVPEEMHDWLLANPGAEVEIDVARRTLKAGGQEIEFPLDGFAQHCFLNGVDALGFLLEQDAAITAYEQARKA
ncbi:MAG: 3-isopropylmalate dehydratase small subunit [Pseudomonadota bacterium]